MVIRRRGGGGGASEKTEATSLIGVEGRKRVTEWFVEATGWRVGVGVCVGVRRDARCWMVGAG